MGQGVSRVNGGTITNRSEVANSDGIKLSADSHIVPNGGPLAHNNFAQESSVRGDPGILGLGDGIIQRHLLSVTGRFLHVSDVVGHRASNSVEF